MERYSPLSAVHRLTRTDTQLSGTSLKVDGNPANVHATVYKELE